MKFEEALEKAKLIAFEDYNNECKKNKSDSGYNATRTWDKDVFDGNVIYSLSGTPPKAYVVVLSKTKKILCKRNVNAKPFETIDFEDEAEASSSSLVEVKNE